MRNQFKGLSTFLALTPMSSYLSFSLDELRHTDIEIRLKDIDGALFFDLEPLVKHKSAHSTVSDPFADFDPGSAYSFHFHTGFDNTGPILRISTSFDSSKLFRPSNGMDSRVYGISPTENPYGPSPSGRVAPHESPHNIGEFPSMDNRNIIFEELLGPFSPSHLTADPTANHNLFPLQTDFLDGAGNCKDYPSESGYSPSLAPVTYRTPPFLSPSGSSSSPTSESCPPSFSPKLSPPSPSYSSSGLVSDPSNNTYSPNQRPQGSEREDRPFCCEMPDCSRRFKTQHTLRSHMETHIKPPNVYICTYGCSAEFTRQHDRLRHEINKHGKICEWRCDDCKRGFSTKKSSEQHKCPVGNGGPRWVT